MAISKRYLKSKPVCKVSFSLSAADVDGAKKVFLVGDFNEWSEVARPMRKVKGGGFTITQDLDVGREYHYRYLVEPGGWINDPDADSYCYSEFAGCDNSVVSV